MTQVFSDESMAEVGRALMDAIETYADKGWHPMDCPSEIVGDLTQQRDDLVEALQGLMEWQVKKVNKWHNSAYDFAAATLKRVGASKATPETANAQGKGP